MTLADLLRPEAVVMPLESTTLLEAAWALVERLTALGVVVRPERLRDRVGEERGEDIVALGDRAFLTHYRTDAVTQLAVAVGVAPHPIARELGPDDTQRARLVLLVLAPPRLSARYLQVVNALAKLVASPATVERMLAALSPAELVSLPALHEVQLSPQLTVRDIMTERPRTTGPETPLRDAAREMVRARIGALPVVEADGLLIGLLSERELMRHMLSVAWLGVATAHHHAPAPEPHQQRRAVRDVMTRQVLCVSPEQPLAEVASLMANKDVDQVPVVREGRLVGFLTRGDIVRKLIGS